MGIHRAEQRIEIAAPLALCFETASDYATFPDWQDAALAVDVLERDDEGRGKLVEFTTDAKFRRVLYRLRYHYEPQRIRWDFVKGDGVAHIEGEYEFEPAGAGTAVTYRLGIDPGIPVPGLVARRANATVMRRSMTDLKSEVERRGG